MTEKEDTEERLRELEIKITFIDDYVSQQNQTIHELSREVDQLKRAFRALSEKAESLGADGNVPPANEKPPHW